MQPTGSDPVCPMDGILRVLSGPWTTYILWCLCNDGPSRYGRLRARMPAISSKVLTERLRMLEGATLVHRDYRPTIPPAVTYSLTPRGAELKGVLDALAALGLRWQTEDAAATGFGTPLPTVAASPARRKAGPAKRPAKRPA